jgi:hypothetical protein
MMKIFFLLLIIIIIIIIILVIVVFIINMDRIAQVVERRPLYRDVRDSNPSLDTMALLLGRLYEVPQCGIIKEKCYSSPDIVAVVITSCSIICSSIMKN